MDVTVHQTRGPARFLIDIIAVVALAGLAAEIAQNSLGLDDPYDLVGLFSPPLRLW